MKNILIIRDNKNLTQEEVAKKAGINRAYLSRVESGYGNPTYKTLIKIAKALDVEVRDLM